ncbi:cupin domain-containing protein [Pseudonocardia sp. CA-107938]|uniref:cupin domain-containing protein n=1 Tax=Pseudonocardia sp. CA-107938 TaxID=3240021 RepID=UPI003D8DC879
MALIAVARGEAWVGIAGDGAPTRMRAGDALVTLGRTPYVVADGPDTPPQVVIDPGPTCRTPDGGCG